jgi:hypothetical protein
VTSTAVPASAVPSRSLALHGGGIQLGGAHALGPRHNVDLPEIAFDAPTTLAFARNGGDVGGMLGVVDGTHAARLGLLPNYMAASFVAAGDGHATPHAG